MKIQLKNLINAVSGIKLIGRDDIIIEGIEYDSRRIRPGMLFAAIPGFKVDGKMFLNDAIKNGAVAAISDTALNVDIPVIVASSPRKTLSDIAACFYGFAGKKLNIAGVTGTNGKSTSVYLIKKIIETSGKKTGMLNSLVYDTGKAKYKAERTTPESLDVQKYLHDMKDAGCEWGVVEVSSHALVLSRVENIDFRIGLFTNFSRDHLDFHHTMDEYLAAKKLFLDKLSGDKKIAVINKDVPEFESFITDAQCPVVTYSAMNNRADIMVQSPELLLDKTNFELITPQGKLSVSMKLLGRYNVSNVAGAAAVGHALGLNLNTIAQALETADPVPGRFRPINFGQPFAVIVDYAHTPDGIERLCQSAREITPGKMMILFGCGGDRDKGKRPLMGELATRLSDFAVITSDNPRTENPLKIIDDILPGVKKENYIVIPDRREAIREIIKRACKDDSILLAGKGAEDYQEIGTTKFPFEDTLEAGKALEELGFKKEASR
jgi:UDP-N-acetylmuramoyl-L-alanyl-D-glutamate--2,6-diaminopimelate ligase